MLTSIVLLMAPPVLMLGGFIFAVHPWTEQEENFEERTRAARAAQNADQRLARKAA